MRSRSSPLLPYANGDKYSAKPGKPRSRCSLFRVVLLGSLAVFLTWSVYTFATIATIKKQAALNSGRTAGDRARLARLAAEQQEAVQASQDTLLQGSQAAKGKAADAAAEPCGEGDCLATGHTADVAAQAADAVTSLQAAGKAGGLYALEAVGVDGAVEPLSKYSGKVVLVVNVASQCGYTDSNYKGLQQLYAKHRDAGFEILAFPCNQFGEQEPGDNAAIRDFAASHYHVTFPMFAKTNVNGPEAAAVYKFLKRVLPVGEEGGGGVEPGTDLNWNFNKFLVDRSGQPVKHYPPAFDYDTLERDITALLRQPHS